MRSVPRDLALALVAAGVLLGPGGCSSTQGPPSSVGMSGSMDAAITCVGDPRGETFAPGLAHKGDSGMLSFVLVKSELLGDTDPDPDQVPVVANNAWILKVVDANGQPVKDADLTFPARSNPSDPWMPDHSNHGAPAAKATNNNDGTYTIAPLYFFMGGIWSTYVSVQSGSVTDSTTFTFCISG